jgi:hypothetical protein
MELMHVEGTGVAFCLTGTLYGNVITTLVVGEGITDLPNRACYNWTSLTSVNLPSTLLSLRDSAFQNCSSLVGISIPDGVGFIGYACFRGCSSLASIVIPESVRRIEGYCFDRCFRLTKATILGSADSPIFMAEYSFSNCGLKEIFLGDSVQSLENRTFLLTNVTKMILGPNISRIEREGIDDSSGWHLPVTEIHIRSTPISTVTSLCQAFWTFSFSLRPVCVFYVAGGYAGKVCNVFNVSADPTLSPAPSRSRRASASQSLYPTGSLLPTEVSPTKSDVTPTESDMTPTKSDMTPTKSVIVPSPTEMPSISQSSTSTSDDSVKRYERTLIGLALGLGIPMLLGVVCIVVVALMFICKVMKTPDVVTGPDYQQQTRTEGLIP